MFESKGGATWREGGFQALLLLAVLMLLFPGVFFRGEVTTPGDILFRAQPWANYAPEGWKEPANRMMPDIPTAFQPQYVLTEEALHRGEWPLWNPCELGGLPMMANFQSAVFYPPRLLYTFLDVHTANTVCVLLKLWLCGMVAFLCARALGLGKTGAQVLSLGWMLNSYNVVYAYWPLPDITAWLPLMFMGLEFLFRGKYRRGVFAIASGGALMILGGHPETAFAMAFDASFYFAMRLLLEQRWGQALWKPVLALAAGWTLALLLTAVQWAPFVEYLTHSYTYVERRDASKFLTSLSPGMFMILFVPRFYGMIYQNNYWGSNIQYMYPGLLVWMGALLYLFRRKESRSDGARAYALGLTILFGFLLACEAPTISLLHKLPVFCSLRLYYHSCFSIFGLAYMAAIGVERWVEGPGRARGLLWFSLPVLAVVAFASWMLWLSGGLIRMMHVVDYVHWQLWTAAGFTVALLALLTAAAFIRRPLVWGLGLAACLAADLLAASWGVNPTMARTHLYPNTALTDFLAAQPKPCRIQVATADIPSGMIVPYGIEEWLAYDGIYPERVLGFMTKLGTQVWNSVEPVCAVQYYLHNPLKRTPDFAKDDTTYFEHVKDIDGVEVYRNKRAFPRAFLVGRVEGITDVKALFQRMESKEFNPGEVILTDQPPKGPLPNASGDLGTAHIEDYSFTRIRVKVDATAACAMTLADCFFPGWRVTIDGRPAEIFPAYYAFRGVLVPQGAHSVEFTYAPLSFRLGMAVSVLSLLAGVPAGLWLLLRARRAAA